MGNCTIKKRTRFAAFSNPVAGPPWLEIATAGGVRSRSLSHFLLQEAFGGKASVGRRKRWGSGVFVTSGGVCGNTGHSTADSTGDMDSSADTADNAGSADSDGQAGTAVALPPTLHDPNTGHKRGLIPIWAPFLSV